MASHDQCVEQLDLIWEAAKDPSAAYLIRSRLRRAILSCARLVADATGAEKPQVPGVFVAPPAASDPDREIIRLCNRIYGIAGELCQPSEAFDGRWEGGWQVLSAELERLRARLVARLS